MRAPARPQLLQIVVIPTFKLFQNQVQVESHASFSRMRAQLEFHGARRAGRAQATAAIDSMSPQRSTNLMAGIMTGFDKILSLPAELTLSEYSINLIITTDGMPSAQWHPARGRDGYASLVKMSQQKLSAARGVAAKPTLVAIGLGFQLDSELLLNLADQFLHMPVRPSQGQRLGMAACGHPPRVLTSVAPRPLAI